MSDDSLPWIEETYGHDRGAPDIIIRNSHEFKKDPINIQDVVDLASITDDYDTINVPRAITSMSDGALKVLNLLQKDRRIWKEIEFRTVLEGQPSSPAFLAILIAAMKKTKRLVIGPNVSGITAYSCLATGLLGQDGIPDLILYSPENLEVEAAKVLAEAMVYTTCLQRLKLNGDRFQDEDVCAIFVEALKRNRSLEALGLIFPNHGTSLPKFLCTLPNHPNLRSLVLTKQNISEQDLELLREWLRRKDCRLQDLEIHVLSFLPTFSRIISGKVFESRMLKRLALTGTNLSSNDLEGLGLCNSFPNLSDLNLRENKICDLSPLEAILCSENCKIQELDLRNNLVSRHSIMKFAAKIPQMKNLRRLYLSDNPFLAEISSLDGREQSASLQPLLKSMKESKSLERISLRCKIDATELCHAMNVNRGGRYGIEVESANRCISPALWPRILHRASSIKYFADINCNWWDKVKEPTDETPRAAVVVSLLRDHANIFEHCGKTEEEDVPNLPASKKRKVEAK
eukprot:CAMPEP_0113626580 /NCGR_PEP_ID=MMETSP0017_2-20120614/13748_1 /TAXON_ID=2856 /ORGANISM="Cylindrotheca closterium" /LENGTH=515 /DNA_ID=CAMNT_0000536769 /DNA_START=104 /DNA_END=1651 /DNA_ORIENTATION=- /assembly_acc=CAM_ASM_000147